MADFLQQENGDHLLQENNDDLLLESSPDPITLTAGTLHGAGHLVTATAFIPGVFLTAGTLHATGHPVVATAALQRLVVAGSLRAGGHLVGATCHVNIIVTAGTLHGEGHTVTARARAQYPTAHPRTFYRYPPDKITVHLYDRAMETHKGELTQAIGINSSDVPGDLGSGSLFVPRDDPYLDSGSILSGDVIRCDQGDTPGFPWVIQKATETVLTAGGEARRGWQLSGPGTLVKWSQALIYPPLGVGRALFATNRWWNWASPELDVSGWRYASEVEKSLVGDRFGFPDLFPDADAYWIWDRQQPGSIALGDIGVIVYEDGTWIEDGWSVPGDGFPPPGVGAMDEFLGDWGPYINLLEDGTWIGEGGYTVLGDGFPPPGDPDYELPRSFAPAGTVYFATTFTKSAYGYVECWGGADDAFELWIDGVPVMRDEGFYRGQTQGKKFALDAGDHHIAIKGTNQNYAKAGVLATIIELNPDGTFGDVICRTDGTWKCLPYPTDPPGFTATKIMRIGLAESQARGALEGCDVGFSDLADSEGNLMPVLAEVSAPIKSSWYSLARQLQETELDVMMRRDALTLDLWTAGAGGVPTAVEFALPTGDVDVDQLRALSHELDNVFELTR